MNISTTQGDGMHLAQKHHKIHPAMRATRVFVCLSSPVFTSVTRQLWAQIGLVYCVKCLTAEA